MGRATPFRTFREFYPFYLREHTNRTSRRLHFVGTSVALALLILTLAMRIWWIAGLALVEGYAFAWIGHFVFEHNRPATFKHPWFSLMGDWRLWWDVITRKTPF